MDSPSSEKPIPVRTGNGCPDIGISPMQINTNQVITHQENTHLQRLHLSIHQSWTEMMGLIGWMSEASMKKLSKRTSNTRLSERPPSTETASVRSCRDHAGCRLFNCSDHPHQWRGYAAASGQVPLSQTEQQPHRVCFPSNEENVRPDIRNIRAYLLTTLYNASRQRWTISTPPSVNHDFNGLVRPGSKKPNPTLCLCEDTFNGGYF